MDDINKGKAPKQPSIPLITTLDVLLQPYIFKVESVIDSEPITDIKR